MSSTASVAVYILSTPNQSTSSDLTSLFQSDLFDVKVVTLTPPSSTDIDTFRFQWVLNDFSTSYGSSTYLLVIKNDSISAADSTTVTATIQDLINHGDSFDVAYLCKYLDSCDQYTNIRKVSQTLISIATTPTPHGFQALLFSPTGIQSLTTMTPATPAATTPAAESPIDNEEVPPPDTFVSENGEFQRELNDLTAQSTSGWSETIDKMLSNLTQQGQLRAVTTLPNLFDVDPSQLASSQYFKTWTCKADSSSSVPSTKEVESTPAAPLSIETADILATWWFWLVIILILLIILIIAIAAYYQSRRAY